MDHINKFTPILLGLIPSTALFLHDINGLLLIILIILWFWKIFSKNEQALKFYQSPFWIISILLVLISIIGLLYSEDAKNSLHTVEKQLSLVIFPTVLPAFINHKRSIKKILLVFIAFVMIASLIAHIDTIIRFINTPEHHADPLMFYFSYWYIHVGLVSIFKISPVYMGLYCNIAILFALYISSETENKYLKRSLIFFIAYQCFFVFQLSARMAIISNLLLIVIGILYYLKNYKLKLITISAFIIIVILCGLLMRGPTSRLLYKLKNISQNEETRIKRWKSILPIIENNLFIGVGTGDAKTELLKQYQNDGLNYSTGEGYNTHNQYLDYLLKFGVVGILSFAAFLLIQFKLAFDRRSMLYFLFLLLICIGFMTENILSRRMGVVTTVFFCSLFYYSLNNWRPINFKINEI